MSQILLLDSLELLKNNSNQYPITSIEYILIFSQKSNYESTDTFSGKPILYIYENLNVQDFKQGLELCDFYFDQIKNATAPQSLALEALRSEYISIFNNDLLKETAGFHFLKQFLSQKTIKTLHYQGLKYKSALQTFCKKENLELKRIPTSLKEKLIFIKNKKISCINTHLKIYKSFASSLLRHLRSKKHPLKTHTLLAYAPNEKYFDLIKPLQKDKKLKDLLCFTDFFSDNTHFICWRSLLSLRLILKAFTKTFFLLRKLNLPDGTHHQTIQEQTQKTKHYLFHNQLLIELLTHLNNKQKLPRTLYNTCPTTAYGYCLNLFYKNQNLKSITVKRALHSDDKTSKLFESNYLLTWGTVSNNIFKHYLPPPTKTLSIGPVIFDPLIKSLQGSKNEVKSFLHSKKHNLIFSPQPTDDKFTYFHKYRLLKYLFETIEDFSHSIHLIIKHHPSESTEDFNLYNEATYKLKSKNYIRLNAHSADINNLIAQADTVLNMFSTVGFAAFISRKPMILLTPFKDYTLPFQFDPCPIAYDKTSLSQHLQQRLNNQNLYTDKEIDTFLTNHMYKVDGNANNRLLESVNHLLTK